MADIKTRDAVKGTIKTIDKAAVASERMKAAYAKTKDKAEQGYYAEENSATEYAADKISHTADRVKDEGIHQFNKQGQKSVQTTKENIIKAKDKAADFKQKRAAKAAEKKKAQAAAERNGSQPRHETASRSPAPDAPANAGANGKSQLMKTRQQGQKTIKTTTDPDNPQEVATMDDNKKQLLKDIFWEMNEISSRTESKTETQITESDDGHGNIVETETTVTQTYLYITVSHKTAEEMADKYGFNEEQRQQLSELLAEENNSLWSAVLYGITIGDGEIVTVALSQVGNAGGEPYWSWYGFDGRVEWCACFVSWCADQCGYIDSGVIPKFAGCVNGSGWFKDRGQWQDGGFTPEAGQIIFFDWEGDGETDHVGIVERCENGIVYTVEGNSGDACRQRSYPVGSSSIYGYGIPAY